MRGALPGPKTIISGDEDHADANAEAEGQRDDRVRAEPRRDGSLALRGRAKEVGGGVTVGVAGAELGRRDNTRRRRRGIWGWAGV